MKGRVAVLMILSLTLLAGCVGEPGPKGELEAVVVQSPPDDTEPVNYSSVPGEEHEPIKKVVREAVSNSKSGPMDHATVELPPHKYSSVKTTLQNMESKYVYYNGTVVKLALLTEE